MGVSERAACWAKHFEIFAALPSSISQTLPSCVAPLFNAGLIWLCWARLHQPAKELIVIWAGALPIS